MAEYDCCECGIHVVLFAGNPPVPPLCGHCLYVPGWLEDFNLRAVLGAGRDLPGAAWPFPDGPKP